MVGPSATEPSSELDEEEPAPEPCQYKFQRSAFERVPSVPLPCPPAFEPSVYWVKSVKRFDEEPPLVPEEEEAVPNPAL